jgi:inosine-uridine nucleoside N-ribohydrolase
MRKVALLDLNHGLEVRLTEDEVAELSRLQESKSRLVDDALSQLAKVKGQEDSPLIDALAQKIAAIKTETEGEVVKGAESIQVKRK